MLKRIIVNAVLLICGINLFAQLPVSNKKGPGYFVIADAQEVSTIYVDAKDDALVQKSAAWMQQDVEMVTGKKLLITTDPPSSAKTIILIGTIEKSNLIQQLINQKKLNVDRDKGKMGSLPGSNYCQSI